MRVGAELPRTETFKVIKRQLSAEGTECADPVWPIARRPVVSHGSLANVGYREFPPPTMLRDLVECAWVVDGPPEPVQGASGRVHGSDADGRPLHGGRT